MRVESYSEINKFNLNRCMMGNFQELRVWQIAKNLAVNIYKLTKTQNFSKDFGLKDQIQRAAVSIPANIGEGDELGTNKQSVRYFYIAKGSAAELQTLLKISHEISHIDLETKNILENECNKISIMLNKLIKARTP
jgi:four helix bundle protein